MTHIGFIEETVMNGKTGGRRRLKRAGALAVVAAAALLAAGCSGDPSSGSVSASALATEVAFAQCMRTHVEPNFPEPPETLKDSGIIIRSPQFLAAAKECKALLPKGSSAP